MNRNILLWMNKFSPIFDKSLELFARQFETNHDIHIIDTNKYSNNFTLFYQQHIQKYDTTTTTTTNKSFCYDGTNGIRESTYMPLTVKGPKKATLISVDMDGDVITDVHAILCFSLGARKSVEIDILCKNQVLVDNYGEASKLLHLLETVCLELQHHVIKLRSVPSAVSYYQKKWYRSKRPNSPSMTKNVRYVSNVRRMKNALTKSLQKSRAKSLKKRDTQSLEKNI